MAKQISVGVGGVVKKAAKVRVGVGGVVKTVKKGVCGIGGVVREFYGGERDGLCIFDNGSTDYTWTGRCKNTGTYLALTDDTGMDYYQHNIYIKESLNLSEYSKCTIIFTDDSNDTSVNASIRLFNYIQSGSNAVVDTGYDRNPGGLVTKTFNLNEDGKFTGTTNFQPGFLFMRWSSSWGNGQHMDDLKIHEIWFER